MLRLITTKFIHRLIFVPPDGFLMTSTYITISPRGRMTRSSRQSSAWEFIYLPCSFLHIIEELSILPLAGPSFLAYVKVEYLPTRKADRANFDMILPLVSLALL